MIGFGQMLQLNESELARRCATRWLILTQKELKLENNCGYGHELDRTMNDWVSCQTAKLATRGVIHVGANSGQEVAEYAARNLNVLWLEPITPIFLQLESNINPYSKQRAVNCLVGDEDDKQVTLHLSNNQGLSSSIMDMVDHAVFYPHVHFTDDVECTMNRLDTIMERRQLKLRDYDALVLDVQGAELLVLRGAPKVLNSIRFLQVESANFELYANYPTVEQIEELLRPYHFSEIDRNVFNEFPDHPGKQCFDITYAKQ